MSTQDNRPTPALAEAIPQPPALSHRGGSIRVELLRQVKRRRTQYGLGAMAAIPVVLAVVLLLTGGTQAGGGTPLLVDLATRSGVNFTLFATFVMSQFFLIVVVALFNGDTISSEASWGSLRYLLIRPLARGTLLRVKLSVALLLSAAASLLIPLTALAVGVVAFGSGSLSTPIGAQLTSGESYRLLAFMVGYITWQMVTVASVAFYLSVRTDAPLGAVGGTVVAIIVMQVLDAIPSLGSLRNVLPTHYALSWFGLLSSPQSTGDMATGLLIQVPYALVLLGLAWRRFARKDILS